MKHIDIDGKILREILAEVQLGVVKLKIKELDDEINKLEEILNYSVDYDSALRASRHLG